MRHCSGGAVATQRAGAYRGVARFFCISMKRTEKSV